MPINIFRQISLKVLVITLEFFAIGIILYLVGLPLYPLLKYQLIKKDLTADPTDILVTEAKAAEFKNYLPVSGYSVSSNRLIIAKIGVNAPIVEASNSDYGLAKGAWRVPESSTPDKGGNTVITGHRFKYLPPNNLTFYLLDKLAPGDIISVLWQDKEYFYKVSGTKIVLPTDTSIVSATTDSILTLYTCDPIYSQEKRLVVTGELIQ